MENTEEIKDMVRKKYSEIALDEKGIGESACCGSGCCTGDVNNIMTDDYNVLEGYTPVADLGLGCGLPTQYAKIKSGDVVVDLGSGAGNDVFIARHETGETGKVIGIDFTPAMIERARKNAEMRALNNVEFRQGDIERMPVSSNIADVVVSNCVLNLVPDKDAVMKEIFRILKPGGHFSISDIVCEGELPAQIKEAAEMYAGCVSGSIQKQAYLDLVESNGFTSITIQAEKAISIPDDVLNNYLPEDQINVFREPGKGIYSITVYAEKPAACCSSDCCN